MLASRARWINLLYLTQVYNQIGTLLARRNKIVFQELKTQNAQIWIFKNIMLSAHPYLCLGNSIADPFYLLKI